MRRRPTLQDIAEVAGVSSKTVSNALLGRPNVSASTRERILATAADIGYVANAAGRGLASGSTGTVAVVVPNLYQPYFAEMAEHVILALEQRGFASTLVIARDGRQERDAVAGILATDVDGVILLPHALTPAQYATIEGPRPTVLLGGPRIPGLDWVAMGEREGMRLVTQHLMATGCVQPVVLWNGPVSIDHPSERFQGILDGLEGSTIAPTELVIITGSDWDRRESGFEAMSGLLRSGTDFDAVISVNDALAVGASRALLAHGLRIPDDVCLTGFDDTDEGDFTNPPLTSVSPEQTEMSRTAVDMLLDRLSGHTGPARAVRTGAHLVIRGSTRRI